MIFEKYKNSCLYLGDCIEVMQEDFIDNTISSVVCDPPYGLSSGKAKYLGEEGAKSGFMGKEWDHGVPGVPFWSEILRVAKPGAYLLAFGGTRTFHRLAVAIEDAGWEIRDTLMWVYGSGFPKSLNIGKVVDKLRGNDREVVGKSLRHNSGEFGGEKYGKYKGGIPDETKGTSKWEGWGTALKPAWEPIILARKPLSDGGLDIAKIICYNIRENDLKIKESIVWRIKFVKPVKKQKIEQTSSSIGLPEKVVVSVNTVSEKETHNIGKEIENALVIGRENIEMITKKNIMKEAEYYMEQTKNEYLQIENIINENENLTLSTLMVDSVSVVGRQDGNSSQLTMLMGEGENIENQSKTQISTYSLKKQGIQNMNTEYSVATATFQWVCMDIVHTIKIKFQNKEYEFEQLSDGSFVWNENLKPFIEPKTLNVASNVLKYGTGGLNIDGCRVMHQSESDRASATPQGKATGKSGALAGGTQHDGERTEFDRPDTCKGRFPANLILSHSPECKMVGMKKVKSSTLLTTHHLSESENTAMSGKNYERNPRKDYAPDGMETVEDWECVDGCPMTMFPMTKSGKMPAGQKRLNSESPVKNTFGYMAPDVTKFDTPGDSGSAARFFKQVPIDDPEDETVKRLIYCAKPSTKERNEGCDGLPIVESKRTQDGGDDTRGRPTPKNSNDHPTVKSVSLMRYLVRLVTPPGSIILDPFLGSGSTGVAALQEGFKFKGIENDPHSFEIAKARISHAENKLKGVENETKTEVELPSEDDNREDS